MTANAEESAARSARGLRRRTLHASAWTFGGFFASNTLRLGVNVALAALVAPEVFGLVTFAELLVRGLKMFSDIGLGPAIVQSKRGSDPAFLNTAWTISVVRGLIIWLVACALTYPLALFYEDDTLLTVVPIAAFASVIAGFNSMNYFVRSRELDMRTVTLLGLSESVVRAAVAIGWATFDPSVNALLAGTLVSRLVFTVMTHAALSGPRSWFGWDPSAARLLYTFGRWILLSTVITFFAQTSDRLVLPKLFAESGMAQLGVYSMALMLCAFPQQITSALCERVLFPAFSKLARDSTDRLRTRLAEARSAILAIGAVSVAAVVLIGPWFFYAFYREAYHGAAWMAPLLAIGVWFRILEASADRALLALGDSRRLAMANGASLAATLAAIFVLHELYGMRGFIAAVVIGGAASYAVIAHGLVRRGLSTIKQDIRSTLELAVLVLAGMALAGQAAPAGRAMGAWVYAEWLAPRLTWLGAFAEPAYGSRTESIGEGVVAVLIAGVVLGAGGVLGVRRVLPMIRGRG